MLAAILVCATAALVAVILTSVSSSHRRSLSNPTVLRRAPATPRIATGPGTKAVPAPPRWQVAWGSAMAWGYGTISHATVRALASVPVDGTAVKVRISNRFGNAPLTVGAATVAQSGGGATVVPGSVVALHFAGAASATIPAGSSTVSDPAALAVSPSEALAVSVYVTGVNLVSSHYPCCEVQTPSYMSSPGIGDLTRRPGALGFGFEAPYSRLLDSVDVERTAAPPGFAAARGSVVVVGDSITDGFKSTARWTDLLQERVAALPVPERPAVVNEAITANALTDVPGSDAKTGGGPPGVQRLMEDALNQPGVATVVLFLGTNDLFFRAPASAVIAGMEQAAAMAHQAGVGIVGVTLLARAGSERWDPAHQAALQQVNQWVLTTQVFDGVIDFASVTADMYNGACLPSAMLPAYDSGDHLHPNAAGAAAMADALDPHVLGLPALPPVPPLVAAAPTPGCAGVPGIPAPGTPQPSR